MVTESKEPKIRRKIDAELQTMAKIDAELQTMAKIDALLADLEPAATWRILNWLHARHTERDLNLEQNNHNEPE